MRSIVLVLSLLGQAGTAAAQFTPVAETFTGGALLQSARGELGRGNAVEAAARISALVQDHAHAWITDEPGRLRGLADWCRQLLMDDPRLLTAWQARVDGPARRAWAAVETDPAHRSTDLYAILLNYPLCTAEPDILAAAMRRAAAEGDLAAALDYAHLARRAGWQPDEAAKPLVDALDHFASAVQEPALAGPAASRPLADVPWAGPVPTDTNWYANLDGFLLPKFLPRSAGGMVYLVTPGQVMALAEGGQVRWAWPPAAAVEVPGGAPGRGILYEPAILSDVGGRPRIVVARQTGLADQAMVLRALRAEDGALLWSSHGSAETAGLSFIGSPAVRGGFVYIVGAEAHARGQALVLVCLDILNGKMVWRSLLGVSSDPPEVRPGRQRTASEFNPQSYLQQSPPAVMGSVVVVGAGGGAVMAFDRFTGAGRWSVAYEPQIAGAQQWKRYLDRRVRERSEATPVKIQQLARYANTPLVHDGVVVAAPSDTDLTFGLDLLTGRQLWSAATTDAAVLIGGGRGLAIYTWQGVEARDVRSGAVLWHYNPPPGSNITGPAAIGGDVVYIPVGRNMVTLSMITGQAVPGTRVPSLRSYIAVGPARALVEASGVLGSFESAEPADSSRRSGGR